MRGTRWRVRWRDPEGRHRKATFGRKLDAERHLTAMTNAKHVGTYIDPQAGSVTFRDYAEAWRVAQVQHRPTTAAHVETNLRRHAYPAFGDQTLATVRPSQVQAWVRDRTDVLAPSTVEVVYRYVAAVFRAAVADRRIASSPCIGVKLPEVVRPRVAPLAVEQVSALVAAVPERYAALVVLAAGTGVRQGEAFGVTIDRVDFLRRAVTIDRQLVLLPGGGPEFGPPKTAASRRTVPLPDVVLESLSQHLADYATGPDGLVFTAPGGRPIRRTSFGQVWRPAVKAVGLPAGTGFHDLRHHYASLLIRAGESVKVVQERLGHANAAETLDTYSHLWPDDDDRTRSAIDAAWRDAPALRHAQGG